MDYLIINNCCRPTTEDAPLSIIMPLPMVPITPLPIATSSPAAASPDQTPTSTRTRKNKNEVGRSPFAVAFLKYFTSFCFKISDPLLQTRLIQFVVYAFQQNIVHCTILTLLTVTPIIMYALYRVC